MNGNTNASKEQGGGIVVVALVVVSFRTVIAVVVVIMFLPVAAKLIIRVYSVICISTRPTALFSAPPSASTQGSMGLCKEGWCFYLYKIQDLKH